MRSIGYACRDLMPAIRSHIARAACAPVQAMARTLMAAEIGLIATEHKEAHRAVVTDDDGGVTPLLCTYYPRAAAYLGSATCDCPQCSAVRGDPQR